MTLSTYIGVVEPVDPAELHAWANEHLLGVKNPAMSTDATEIANEPGQGFYAWLITHHNNGEPIVWFDPTPKDETPSYYDSREEYLQELKEEEAEYYTGHPTLSSYMDFDTAYSFREGAMGCTELHVMYLIKFAKEFAEPRGLTVWWRNEYDGTWHEGLDEDAIKTVLKHGGNASRWFQNVALPAITRGL
jgi:hypothetical protein